MLFEYFVCLGAAGTGAGVRDGTTTASNTPGGGLCDSRSWTFDLGVQTRPSEIRRSISSAQASVTGTLGGGIIP
jgi:hypothetical protein